MWQKSSNRGFSWVELAAILGVLAVLLGLLMPAIQNWRENARLRQCQNNLKNIGQGLLNYESANRRFPPSADILDDGTTKTVGGWSFLAKILPYTTYGGSVNLPISTVSDPLAATDAVTANARGTSISEFLCPSNRNKIILTSPSGPEALTNYKAMGATCAESLIRCVSPAAPVPYGDKLTKHPDGALFPGAGIRIADMLDGMSNIIFACETMDDSASAWMAGSDVTLVGMPKAEEYERAPSGGFWAPKGFNWRYYDEASPSIQKLRTFFSFDFSPNGPQADAYPASVGRTPMYGPSSAHAGIIQVLYGDGTARPIRKDVDYMPLVSRIEAFSSMF